jgi:class I fructose-bisphosphate aldolase
MNETIRGGRSPGSEYRMARLFPEGGAAIICPIDHGLYFGRIKGLENPVAVLRSLARTEVTGFLMSPGLIRQTQREFGQAGHLARVMTLDFYWAGADPEQATSSQIARVTDAVKLDVDCIKLLMPWNVSDLEKVALTARIGEVIAEAGVWHMPVMVEPIVLGQPRGPDVVKAEREAARVAYELGADIIKIAFPGRDATAAMVAELGVPVVIAGGPRAENTDEMIEIARDAIAAGARGLVLGRNVWQRPPSEATAVMAALARVAREGSGKGRPVHRRADEAKAPENVG